MHKTRENGMNTDETRDLHAALRGKVATAVDAAVERFSGAKMTSSTRAAVRAAVSTALRAMEARGDIPPDYMRHAVRMERNEMAILMHRNFVTYPMSEAEFAETFGREPVNDDQTRVNCGEAGVPGHQQCGWCIGHGTARFQCGCVAGADRPGAGIGSHAAGPPAMRPPGDEPEPYMTLRLERGESVLVTSASDVDDALERGAIGMDDALVLRSRFVMGTALPIRLTRYLPERYPPLGGRLLTSEEIGNFIAHRFPAVDDLHVGASVAGNSYLVTVTSRLTGGMRDDLERRIFGALAPWICAGIRHRVSVVLELGE